MKKLLLFLLFIYCSALDNNIYGQINGCPTPDCQPIDLTNDGRPHMAGCFAGIEKHLARAVAAEKIQHLMAWECPAGSESSCSQTICDFIDACVSVNAAYITRAAGPWGNEDWFGTSRFINSLSQFVDDVNNAYDCADLRRPLIQANIFENIDANNSRPFPGNGIYLIELVPIQHEVLKEFYNEMTPPERSTYFTNPNDINTPRNINFTFENVIWQATDMNNSTPPDLHKIEGKMWLFQCAKIFIDAGFTSLHMGQVHMWGRIGTDKGKQNLGEDLLELTDLIGRIRAYAHSLPGELINFPTGHEDTGIIITYESGNTDYFRNNDFNQGLIFDHNQYDAKPNEITGSNHDQAHVNSFNAAASNCSGFKNAIIDHYAPYKHNNFPVSYATSPMGCTYPGRTPGSVYLDQGGGIQTVEINGTPVPHGNATPQNSGNDWGWDDATWFRQELKNDLCKGEWLAHEIEWARTIENGTSTFMQVPLAIKSTDITTLLPNPPTPVFDPGEYWYMHDHPDVLAAVQNAWQVKTPTIQVTGSGGYRSFKALNTDNNSIYSWHIKLQSGQWLPFTYGSERNGVSLPNGFHEIRLRQDNIGIPTTENLYGVREIITSIFIFNWGGFKLGSENDNELEIDFETSYSSQLATQEQIRETELYSIQNGMIEENLNSMPLKEKSEFDASNNLSVSKFEVFPNPTSDNFIVTMPIFKPGNLKLSLYNTLGKKIKELANETINYKGDYSYEGTLSDLPSGTYLVLLELDGEVQTQKLFKQ